MQIKKRRIGLTNQCGALEHIDRMNIEKKNEHTFVCSFLVHEAGVEPARPCEHWHLKPASLPIPPLVHQMVLRNKFLSRRDLYSSTVHLKCQQLFLEIKKLLSESLSPSLPHGEKYPHGQKGKETRTELCPLWVSLFCLAGADDGTRTRTRIHAQAPQACQSTNSSTSANQHS